MKKRFTSLMTTLILSVFFAVSASAYDFEVDGIYYNYVHGTTVEVTSGNNQYKGEIVIPDTVTFNNVSLNVKRIGKNAFYKCNSMTSVVIPNTVEEIGEWAFYYCSGLTSLIIPNSVKRINWAAFHNCSDLKSITIGNNVETIGFQAFTNCSALTSVQIPNSVVSIGADAFSYCKGLKLVEIPNSVTTIGDCAFYGCIGISSISIPNSVITIGERVFEGCTSLTSINLPNSITNFGDCIFRGCDSLSDIIILKDLLVYIPKNFTGHYSIPDYISTIIGGAFEKCSGLTSVTIPKNVTSIGNYAFAECISLYNIEIPDSVSYIGEWAFYGCNDISSISIPNSVSSIGEGAFSKCKKLTTVKIPNSVSYIGDGVFYGSNNVSKLYIDCSLNPNLDSDIEELYIGDNVYDVYDYFNNLLLKRIVLGKNVIYLHAESFSNSKIEEFTITGEEPPYLYPNVFGSQNLSNATLYVPESKTEYYQTTEPWSKFGKILTLSGETPSEPEKCATPSISFSEGQLLFSCETEGAKCYYTLNNSDVKNGETLAENNSVNLSACYDITCYATAYGYKNSDVATARLYWLPSSGTLETANINNVAMRGIAIQSAVGFINISGLDNNEKVDFYGVDGKALGSAKSIDGNVSFSAKQGSVVVAKIGKESVKIAVE